MMHKHHFYVMEIWIKTLTGASLQLLVSPYDSVYNVKFRIQKLEGIPMSQQHLIWQSTELEDDRTLQEYQIYNGATLQLVLGMRGGPVNIRRVPSEAPSVQDMADMYLAEYLSEARDELMSPSGRHPVTYIVYQTGDHFNLYCVFDREGSSASNHHELLFSGTDEKGSPLPGVRMEENEKTREKMQLVRSQMENMSLMKERKAKTSRKSHQSSRPPSSRSVSRQKLHRLSGATAATAVPVARPPSVFNKIPLLPPIGATAATSVSPGYNSDDASVPLGASANPAAETLSWSPQAQCSSTLSTHVENDVDVTPPAVDSVTLTPNSEIQAAPTYIHRTARRQTVLSDATVVDETSSKRQGSTHMADERQQIGESSSLILDAVGGTEPLPQTSPLSTWQSGIKIPGSTTFDVSESKPDCSRLLSCAKIAPEKEEEGIVELPLPGVASGRLKVTDAACQCDETQTDSLGMKPCETGGGTQASDRMPIASSAAAGTDDAAVSSSHPSSLSDPRTRSTDRWSRDLISTTSILGFSPSPTSRRLRSGASSRTAAAAARKFHGLNVHEMQTVSSVLNSLAARSQSRAAAAACSAGLGAGATVTTIAGGSNTEPPRVLTAERVRLPSAHSQLRKWSAGRSRGSAGFRLPSVKMAVRKKSGKRCSICGKKTRLGNGFQCRCGNNFCTLHRYAEAHACTYDYKTEGRKLIKQNNPIITAPKLPKI